MNNWMFARCCKEKRTEAVACQVHRVMVNCYFLIHYKAGSSDKALTVSQITKHKTGRHFSAPRVINGLIVKAVFDALLQ